MSLLIIEDDQPFLELMLRSLKPKSFRVAHSLAEAFQLIDQEAPKVILLDLRLPGSPVDETLSRIPELKARSKDAIIIVLTGYPDLPRLQEAALLGGAKSVLSKDSAGIFGALSEEVLKSMNAAPESPNPVVAQIEAEVKKIVAPE